MSFEWVSQQDWLFRPLTPILWIKTWVDRESWWSALWYQQSLVRFGFVNLKLNYNLFLRMMLKSWALSLSIYG